MTHFLLLSYFSDFSVSSLRAPLFLTPRWCSVASVFCSVYMLFSDRHPWLIHLLGLDAPKSLSPAQACSRSPDTCANCCWVSPQRVCSRGPILMGSGVIGAPWNTSSPTCMSCRHFTFAKLKQIFLNFLSHI